MTDSVKRCRNCGEVKPLDEFHCQRSSSDRRVAYCKACVSARRKLRYQRDKEIEKERSRAYYRQHRRRYLAAARRQYRQRIREDPAYNRAQYRARVARYPQFNQQQYAKRRAYHAACSRRKRTEQ